MAENTKQVPAEEIPWWVQYGYPATLAAAYAPWRKLARGARRVVGSGAQAARGAPGALRAAGSGLQRWVTPKLTAIAAPFTAADAAHTPTEQYYERFGLDGSDPSLLADLGVRTLGAASDLGNNLFLGIPGQLFYRDKQGPTMPEALAQQEDAGALPADAMPPQAMPPQAADAPHPASVGPGGGGGLPAQASPDPYLAQLDEIRAARKAMLEQYLGALQQEPDLPAPRGAGAGLSRYGADMMSAASQPGATVLGSMAAGLQGLHQQRGEDRRLRHQGALDAHERQQRRAKGALDAGLTSMQADEAFIEGAAKTKRQAAQDRRQAELDAQNSRYKDAQIRYMDRRGQGGVAGMTLEKVLKNLSNQIVTLPDGQPVLFSSLPPVEQRKFAERYIQQMTLPMPEDEDALGALPPGAEFIDPEGEIRTVQ